MWSTWAWVMITASKLSNGNSSGAEKNGCTSSGYLWVLPQHLQELFDSLVVTKCIARPTSRYDPSAETLTHGSQVSEDGKFWSRIS